ncbi:MAG: hypothetical protein QXO76_00450 [Thermoproteota archaeon]
MRVYRCVLKVISPMIIGNERTSRGFYTTTDVIPGHTVGGAVNRALQRGTSPDSILISSPAYPVSDGHETLPAHPFYYECKVCEGRVFSTLDDEKLRMHIQSGWDSIKARLVALRDVDSHPVRSLHPGPVVPEKGGEVRVTTQLVISVGIDKHTAASQYGLLFEYLAIEPGQEYWFTLASRGGIDIPNEFEVQIGRGISRGYGRALVKVKEADSNPSIPYSADGEVLLYAISPVPLRFVSEPINIRECAVRYGLDVVDGELEMLRIGDRPAAFGSIRVSVAGWPYGAPSSRERIESLSSGSIIVCRWRLRPSSPDGALAALRYFGIPLLLDSGYVEGLCMLHPFEREPLKEVR